MDDQYLFLMVAVITTPILVTLIVQVTAFPLALHQHKITDEVRFPYHTIFLTLLLLIPLCCSRMILLH